MNASNEKVATDGSNEPLMIFVTCSEKLVRMKRSPAVHDSSWPSVCQVSSHMTPFSFVSPGSSIRSLEVHIEMVNYCRKLRRLHHIRSAYHKLHLEFFISLRILLQLLHITISYRMLELTTATPVFYKFAANAAKFDAAYLSL